MVRDTNYFADQIAAKYPELPPKEIRKLCRLLMQRIYGNATRDRDVRLCSGTRNVSLKIYKPDRNATEHNKRVAGLAKQRYRRQQAGAPTSTPLPDHE